VSFCLHFVLVSHVMFLLFFIDPPTTELYTLSLHDALPIFSSFVKTESEAIQYAMLVLLISIFFSGFFIPIDRLLAPVQVVSYLLPATYGIAALQEVSFLGRAPDLVLVGGAAAYALVTLLAAWALMRRQGITTHVRQATAEAAT